MTIKCDYCGKDAELVKGDVVYPERPELRKLYFWQCAPCHARVGCHKGTKKPFGRLADSHLRYWKVQAHEVFDRKWKSGGQKKRTKMYFWLAGELGISEKDCHIGMFDVETCKKVVEVCSGNS